MDLQGPSQAFARTPAKAIGSDASAAATLFEELYTSRHPETAALEWLERFLPGGSQIATAKGEMERVKKAGAQNMGLRKKDIPQLRDAANRWTDNCFEVRKKFIEKFNMDAKEVDKHFEIQGLDYID